MKGTYLGGKFMTLPLAQPTSNQPITEPFRGAWQSGFFLHLFPNPSPPSLPG